MIQDPIKEYLSFRNKISFLQFLFKIKEMDFTFTKKSPNLQHSWEASKKNP